jgi:ABC-type amino acid transport substrate-binding protein
MNAGVNGRDIRILALVALGVSSLVVGSAREAAADWEQIRKRGTLRVMTDEDPSMSFDNELMDGFLKLHGLKIEMVRNHALAERIPMVMSGQADVAMALFITPEREKLVDFTVEVLPTVYTMATCRPGKPVDTIEQLRARKVGLMKGSIMEQTALRAGVPAENIVGLPEIKVVIESLCAGRVTAALVAMPDLAAYRSQFPGLEYGAPMDRVMSAGWAVAKENPRLRSALNDYLTAIRRSGRWNQVVVKHFGPQALAVLARLKTP